MAQQNKEQLRPAQISVNQHHLQIEPNLITAAGLHCRVCGSHDTEPRQDPTRDVESRDYSATAEVASGTHVRHAVRRGRISTPWEAGEAVGITTPT